MADLATTLTTNVTALLGSLSPGTATQALYSAANDSTHVYTRNTGLFAAGADLTCIATDNTYAGADDTGVLITPSILVTAAHFGSPVGATYYFTDNANVTYSRTVNAPGYQIPGTDILLSRLSSPLPSAITPAWLLPANAPSYIVNSIGPENSPLCIYTRQDRLLYVGNWSGTFAVGQPSVFENLFQAASESAWFHTIISGDSGSVMGLILGGVFVVLGVWYEQWMAGYEGVAASLGQNLSGIAAGIAALGVSESVTTVDLSSFTIPSTGGGSTGGSTTYGGVGMTTTYDIFADGTGTSTPNFTTIAAAIIDDTVLATVGIVSLRCKGNVGPLGTLDPTTFACSILNIIPMTGYAPGLIPQNDSAVACISSPSATTPCGGIADGNVGGSNTTCTAVNISVQIGSATSSGMFTVSYLDAASGGILNNVNFVEAKFRSCSNIGTGTKRLVTIWDQVGAGGTTFATNFQNCIISTETASSATTEIMLSVSVLSAGNVQNVNFQQSMIDGTNQKGLQGIVRLQTTAAGTVNFNFSNSIIAAASTSQATFSTSLGGGSINIAGSGLITSDNQTNGTNLVIGKLASAVWAGPAIFDYYLSQASAALNISNTTAGPGTDILGGIRPRNGTIVDAGPVNLQFATPVTLTAGGTGTFMITPQTVSSQAGTDGTHYSACSLGSFSLPAGTKTAYVQNLDSGGNVIAQGTGALAAGGNNLTQYLCLGMA